jgi:hypothetical protein
MAEGKRFGLSAMQKIDMWCRWKAGQSLHVIARAFGKSHSSIRCVASPAANRVTIASNARSSPCVGSSKPSSNRSSLSRSVFVLRANPVGIQNIAPEHHTFQLVHIRAAHHR